jgi:5S rRNA maturation endonuclease (ribonuclease M5)
MVMKAGGPPTRDDIETGLARVRAFDASSDGVIIVEGKRDVKALAKLGISKTVIHLDAPLFKVIERVAERAKQVIILTDLDEEGRKLYHELSIHFQRLGVKVDDTFRNLLFRTPLRHIEGLDTFVDNLGESG